MHPQMMLLLEIQDLHLQKAALLEEPGLTELEEGQFHIDPKQAAAAIDEKIDELKDRLDPSIRIRCEKGLPSRGRMVVPVIGGVCYGCFMSIPTSRTLEGHKLIQTCENCGRFLYFLS